MGKTKKKIIGKLLKPLFSGDGLFMDLPLCPKTGGNGKMQTHREVMGSFDLQKLFFVDRKSGI